MPRFQALQAQYGDCFLLRWGAAEDKLAVIDGGPPGTYPILRERLLQAANVTPVSINLMMVSHIDDDHINGLLALMRDLRDLKQAHKPLPITVQRFWFNGFEDLIGATGGTSAPTALSSLASNDAELRNWASYFKEEKAIGVLASVGQGRQLRDLIALFDLKGNQPIGSFAMGSPAPVDVDGLKITVVGPLDDQLSALRSDWAKAPLSSKAALAAYLDTSTANLSSIVCLVENSGKKILLTGDARGDYILDGLHKYGHLDAAGRLKLDIMKVPHHGSNRDAAPDFFAALPAEHYVISANGKYNNPDRDTLKWLIDARGTDSYTIHLTNQLPWMEAFFDRLRSGRNFTVQYRGTNDGDIIDIAL